MDLLLERMRRAEELCSIQTRFVHPLNFQESLVRPPLLHCMGSRRHSVQ